MKISIKKFLLFTFVLLEFASVACFANTPLCAVPNTPGVDAGKRLKISLTIILGKKPDCIGFGICEWSLNISRTVPNSIIADMYVDDYNKNIIVLEVDRTKGMSPETNSRYFNSGYFQMDADSPIPQDVLKALGISGAKTLASGKYAIVERSGLSYISIPVK